MTHLISLDELESLSRPMSPYIDAGQKLICIDEAERLDVVPNIGADLYLELLDNLESEDYSILLNGGQYVDSCGVTHIIKGLKSTVAYYAYARLIRLADNVLTRFGLVNKTDEYSQVVSGKDKVIAYTDAKIVADGYLREIVDYLRCDTCACGAKYRRTLFKYGRPKFKIVGE